MKKGGIIKWLVALIAIVFCGLLLGLANSQAVVKAGMAADIEIKDFSPKQGSMRGGNIITIHGKNFQRKAREHFIDVASGLEHSLLLSENGQVWSVGRNEKGQLGNGNDKPQLAPVNISKNFNLMGNDRIIGVWASGASSFALSAGHHVFAWGDGTLGKLGDGGETTRATPVDITGNFELQEGEYIKQISAGSDTTFAVTNKGRAFVWGSAKNYQSGQTNDINKTFNKPVLATWLGVGIQKIAAGHNSYILLDGRGDVMTWGANEVGQLARKQSNGANYSSSFGGSFPVTEYLGLSTDDKVVDVAAGNGAVAVITKNGRVLIWGKRSMLGIGADAPNPADHNTGDQFTSVPRDITKLFSIEQDDRIAQISMGNNQVIARSQYGRIFSWGSDVFGELGRGTVGDSSGANIVEITKNFNLEKGTTIEKLATSGRGDSDLAGYSFALDSKGRAWSWGGSKYGAPGINLKAEPRRTPTLLSDRLSATIGNVAQVLINGKPASVFEIVNDTTMKLAMPAMAETAKVSISLVDFTDHEVVASVLYQYIIDSEDEDNEDSDSKEDDSQEGKGDDSQNDIDKSKSNDPTKEANKSDKPTNHDANNNKQSDKQSDNISIDTNKHTPKRSNNSNMPKDMINNPTAYWKAKGTYAPPNAGFYGL